MKRVLTLYCAVLASLALYAQNSTSDDIAIERDKQIDAIMAPVQDIEARYWAYRVTQVKDVTLEKLEHLSKQWLGSEQAHEQQIALIKQYVQSRKPVSITPQERASLDKANEQVWAFLNSPLADIKTQRDKKIDAIEAPIRDIEARYWAQQVQNKVIMLETLEYESRSWLGSQAANQELIDLVRKYVYEGKPVSVTAEELEKLDENKRKVRMFLNNGHENPAAAALAHKNRQIRNVKEPVFELEARYWAYRVAKVKDVTFEELKHNSHTWVGEHSYNQKLINKIAENLRTGNTQKLTKQEEKLLEETNKQVRQLLQ